MAIECSGPHSYQFSRITSDNTIEDGLIVKISRRRISLLVFIAAAFCVLGTIYHRARIPFDTAQQFVDHIHAGRIGAAQAMMNPAERSKLPKEYWDRIATVDFKPDLGFGVSYTGGTLLRSIVAFWLIVPDGASWYRDDAVQYYAKGRQVYVEKTDFALLSQ